MLKVFLKHICEHLYERKMKQIFHVVPTVKLWCTATCITLQWWYPFLTDTHSEKRPKIKIWKCIKTHKNYKDIDSHLNQDKQMRSKTRNAAASLNFTTIKCLTEIPEHLTLNWSNKFSAFKSVQLLLDCSNSMIEAVCQECLMPWCSWQ